jgi:hypothetical protein
VTDAVDRSGLRPRLLKQQAEAGDITLLFGDESEALTHPYLARAWPTCHPAVVEAFAATDVFSPFRDIILYFVGQLPTP